MAYYDLNANNFYDVGEGISGLTVNVSGATYYCTTATGGGWVVPVPATAATRTVTFSGTEHEPKRQSRRSGIQECQGGSETNVYPARHHQSRQRDRGQPAHPGIHRGGRRKRLQVEPLDRRHRRRGKLREHHQHHVFDHRHLLRAQHVRETTRHGLVPPGKLYSPVPANRSSSTRLYYGQASPALSFQSRIRYATTSEQFKVQVKEEGSTTWQDVFSQTGTNSSGESAFTLRSATLTGMTGKAFRVRFLLSYTSGGSYYDGYSGDYVGWFIDAITFTGVATLGNNVSQTLTGTSGSFTPSQGSYLMSVAPVISNRDFPASYQTLTVSEQSQPPPPTFLTWAANLESTNSLAAGTIASQPNADFDRDGRANLIEYAFGTSPVSGNDPAPRMPVAKQTATHFVLQYQRDTALTDIILTAQACSNLGNWKAPGETGAPGGFSDVLISTSGTLQTREAKIPRTSGNCFMRVRITRP